MSESKPGPYEVELEEGETYLWCACGKTQEPPFCDQSHRGTGIAPKRIDAEKTETVYLCGCGQTKTPPYCDDSHLNL